MNMRFVRLLPIAAIVYVACKSSSPTAPITPTPNYFPLTVGSSWHYAGYATDSAGVMIANTNFTESDSVTGTDTIGGESAFVIREVRNDTSVATFYYSFTTNGELQMFHDTTDGLHTGYWELQAAFDNSTVGNSTTRQHPDRVVFLLGPYVDTLYGSFTLVETLHRDSSITVGAGTFTVQVRSDSTIDALGSGSYLAPTTIVTVQTNCYAPNVGKVKAVELSTVTGGLRYKGGSVTQLVSYSIK